MGHQTYILHREAPVLFGIPSKNNHNVQYIHLNPGANIISEEAWEAIKSDSIIQNMIFEKTLVPLDAKTDKPDAQLNEVIDITTRPESEAKAIIKATFTEAPLLAWLSSEKKQNGRKSVINCIQEQLEEIQDKPAKGRR